MSSVERHAEQGLRQPARERRWAISPMLYTGSLFDEFDTIASI